MDNDNARAAVYVPFVLTKRGTRTLRFAGDLANILGRDLVVLMGSNESQDKLAEESGISTSGERDLVRETVIDLTKVASDRCRIEKGGTTLPAGSIRVTSDSKNWHPNPSEATFFSASEVGLFTRGKGPLYVTVGDKWTHPTAIVEAVTLAKTLGVGVVLYHSTWKNKGVNSEDPRDHVSRNALKVISSAVRIARDVEVPVEIALEHAPTIADGVLRHAIENDASAIVMTKSARSRRGSYVDQVVMHSPVPVYVVPLSNGGKSVDDLPEAMKDLPFSSKGSRPKVPRGIAYIVMAIVLLMYLLKVRFKIDIGTFINSPVIEGDGWHNVADIFEALMVIATIYLASRPRSRHYPYGWKNLEHIFAVATGLSLGWMGFTVLKSSVSSIVAIFSGTVQHKPLLMGPQYFSWAAGVMAISVVLSLVVSTMQIHYGKKYGYPSVVADGEETLSDARVEVSALTGVLSEYLFGLPQIEYFLGTVMASFILHASYKIFINGMKGLLGHSMGDEGEEAIREIVVNNRGVLEVVKLQSSITGSSVTVDLHLMSKVMRPHHLRMALESKVTDYCVNNGFIDAECHVEFEEPKRPNEDQVERVAFAAIAHPADSSLAIIAPSLDLATHIVGADDEKYSGRRSFIDPMPRDLSAYLRDKHMKTLYVYGSVAPADVATAGNIGVPILAVPTYCLEYMGA